MKIASLLAISLIVASAGSGRPAAAQDAFASPPVLSREICPPRSSTELYVDCALRLEGGKILQGARGYEIARQHLFFPMPARDLVKGDSARRYAADYETLTKISTPFQWLAVIGFSIGLANNLHHCSVAGCADATYKHAARTWGIIGVSSLAVSIPFTGAAKLALTRSLWWNNAFLQGVKP